MAKPPETPPSSDIDGVHEDRVDRLHPKTFDAAAGKQMEADDRETIARPKRGEAPPAKGSADAI
ncbi:MAG: hypothetical protein Q7J32_09440 [Sphingomonadaceae bacterium]|nr:hypothetical protein [Sphingomonadaceae bacterium]